jgi:hypothetical protein
MYAINPNASINEGNLYADGSLSVNIFYSSPSYTNIQEKPAVTPLTLVPDLGGRLGLFIGVSVLSFIEWFEVSYEFGYFLIRRFMFHRRSKNKTN